MSDHHHGLVKLLAGDPQQTQHILAGPAVQVPSGLVSQQNGRLCRQSSGNGYPLLLPSGKLAGKTVFLLFQAQHADHIFQILPVRLFAVQPQGQGDILHNVQHRDQIIALEYKANSSGIQSRYFSAGK